LVLASGVSAETVCIRDESGIYHFTPVADGKARTDGALIRAGSVRKPLFVDQTCFTRQKTFRFPHKIPTD
jgi:hypothetical protein